MTKNIHETLHFKLVPSKQIEMIVDALHLLAILACWLNALSRTYQLSLSVAVLALWFLHKRRRRAIPVHLSYTSAKGWEISYDGSHYLIADILETTVITRIGVFFHYRIDDHFNRNLLIPKDSLPANDFRRLVVRLKLSGTSQNR